MAKIEYEPILCEYKHCNGTSVLVAVDDVEYWISLTNLSWASSNSVNAEEFSRGEEIELKVARWFVRKQGL